MPVPEMIRSIYSTEARETARIRREKNARKKEAKNTSFIKSEKTRQREAEAELTGEVLHIIMIGWGMGGLLATLAAIQAGYSVTVLESHGEPTGSVEDREEQIQQIRHIHVLSQTFLDRMEEVFPTFRADVRAAGGDVVPTGSKFTDVKLGGRRLTKELWGLETLTISREWIEKYIADYVKQHGNVHFIGDVSVEKFLVDESNTIIGVEYSEGYGLEETRNRRSKKKQTQTIYANKVAFAGGKRGNVWLSKGLKRLGYELPEPREVDPHVKYTSIDVHSDLLDQQEGVRITGALETPEVPYIIGIVDQGADPHDPTRNISRITLIQRGETTEYPKTKEEFLELVLTAGQSFYDLVQPAIEATVTAAQAEAEQNKTTYNHGSLFYDYGKTATVDRKYYDLNLPKGLFLLGDIMLELNPRYGQGSTVAMAEALVMKYILDEGGTTEEYYEIVKEIIAAAWQVATFPDLGFKETTWKNYDVSSWTPIVSRAMVRFADDLQGRSSTIAGIILRFLNGKPLIPPPSRWFRPRKPLYK